MKTCYRCKVEKELSAYSKNKSSADGLCTVCKECQKLSYNYKTDRRYNKTNIVRDENYDKEYREKNKEAISAKKKQYREENKEKIRHQKQEYYERNKERKIESSKEYYRENKEKMKDYQREYQKEYREKNKDTLKEKYKGRYTERRKKYNSDNKRKYNSKREKERKREDPLYRLKCNIKSAIRKSFLKNGYSKNAKTYEILGCSFEEFYSHIESLFLEGMSWDNRSEWHIDHIVPISFGESEEEILMLNHYSNLRPLWGKDNLEKSARLVEESINHPLYHEIIKSREK